MVADAGQDVQPLDVVKSKADTVDKLYQWDSPSMQESGSSWSRWCIIHVLEHQQDDDYIDDRNDDLTDLMQDD